MGRRAGALTALTSALLAVLAAVLINRNVLIPPTITRTPWMALTSTLMLLAVTMTLLILFYGFQERLIGTERRTRAELLEAKGLLEEQNATLEQKVQERTRELQSSNHSLKRRNAALATLNKVSEAMTTTLDVKALARLVGDQVRVFFDVDSSIIMLLDSQTNLIHVPYEYDKNEGGYIESVEPFRLGTGLASKVITSARPLIVGSLEEAIHHGAYFPPEIIAKGSGIDSQSWLGVPIMVGDRVLGLVALSDDRPHAFNRNHMRLLQTLSSNLGTAIENARLFDEVRRQEQHAQEMQRRLADIIEFLPDATLVIDHSGQVIAWNRAMEEMTGVPAMEMLGKGSYEYALPFYGERRPILIDLVDLPEEKIAEQYSYIHRDGAILTGEAYTPALKDGAHYLYATASALHDAEGNTVGAIEIIRDITDRKRAEEELKSARAAADRANHAKSAFMANMSHELRTPLNAIIGFTRIVRRKAEGLLPDKQTDNLDKVLASGDHLLGLINTVLDIAKIEAGRMDVLAANFRIAALVDLCFNTAQPLLKPNVVMEKRVDETLSLVHSDQDKIRQIVLNLLSNAAKFTHEGRIVLAAERDGENLRLCVSDTGIGISAEALPRIFKEFQQAESTTTRQYGGTGLGLAISRNLARLLGGDLTVQSEPGKGSIFTLLVPIQYGAKPLPDLDGSAGAATGLESSLAPAPERHDPSESQLSPPLRPGQPQVERAPVQAGKQHPEPVSAKKRILVIDDDPDAVYLLRENLSQEEFEIIGAQNGEDGLRLAGEARPLAILLDVVMPGLDGWQVLYDLKASPATCNIPVVFLTIVDNKALGYQLGAAGYLLKPLDPASVQDTLHRVMGTAELPPKRLLVVDDDPHVVDMLRQFLPESDFCLESALDGEAGLRAIAANRPDLVLLDLIMPRLDGFGVIARLHSNPQTRDLPVIVITAKDLTPGESTQLKQAVAHVMQKEKFEAAMLLEEIHNVLRPET
jgi:PAS domain S-box-containing protein